MKKKIQKYEVEFTKSGKRVYVDAISPIQAIMMVKGFFGKHIDIDPFIIENEKDNGN